MSAADVVEFVRLMEENGIDVHLGGASFRVFLDGLFLPSSASGFAGDF
jgi:hypothetical protein